MIQETILAATLVVMVDGNTIQTPMESYIECQRSAKILKKEDRDAFCIPRQRETDRVRDMMWDFMDMIEAIRERDDRGKSVTISVTSCVHVSVAHSLGKDAVDCYYR